MKEGRLRTFLSIGLRGSVSVGLLWFVVSGVGIGNLVKNVAALPIESIIVAILLSVVGVGLSAWKWNYLLSTKGISLHFRAAWVYYYIGQFFNTFLPSVIGGDTARIYYLYADTGKGAESASSVIVERIIGLYSICVIVAFGTAIGQGLIPHGLSDIAFLGAVSVLLVAPLFVFTNVVEPILDVTIFRIDAFSLGARLQETFTAVHEYRSAKRVLAIGLLISLVFRFVLITSNYVIALGLGIDISFIYVMIFIPLVEFFLFLPISIQGFGVREAAYVYLFTAIGVPSGLALTFGFVMQIILRVVNNMIGGGVYAVHTLLTPSS